MGSPRPRPRAAGGGEVPGAERAGGAGGRAVRPEPRHLIAGDGGGPGARVAVVGGGIVGLTCALDLARAGHAVRLVTADDLAATTSAVAAALWFPYRAGPVDDVLRWAAGSLAVFRTLAEDGAPGVSLRGGIVVHRTPEPDHEWVRAVGGARAAEAGELPPGAPAGMRCTLPVIDMGRYLPWLAGECRAAGVEITRGSVDRLTDVPGDVVVLAAGLRSGALVGDHTAVPVQGQVVRLANPGLRDWLLDEDNPAGLTYVVPRGEDVVCGGTAVEGATGVEPDPAVEAAILRRVRALVPALRDAAVTSRAVGLRPGRPTVRLDRTERDGRPLISCYGHGGAGVTLSWGCAADVVRLV